MELIEKILSFGPLCDHCLGRFFGKRSHSLSNEERGRALRIAYALQKNTPYSEPIVPCWLCGTILQEIEQWANRIVTEVAPIEYSSFLIGTKVPPLIVESEEMVWSDCGLADPEPFKAEMNREVGKVVAAITKKAVDFTKPDIVAICNIAADRIEIQITPVFVKGRYCKYERGIPQTRWFCRSCKGNGCPACNFTGKMYQDSIEELIGRHFIEMFQATDAILHGSGREDIDARMIGSGRPFVMEVVRPYKRCIDLKQLEERINRNERGRVAVALDCYTGRSLVETIKSKKAYKKYRILVEVDGTISFEELNSALRQLKGAVIHQRTPLRVAHRRADKVRDRHVIDIEASGVEDDRFSIEVSGEAGLYIKELISGDSGRTDPSLSGIIGRSARVISLDVVHVEGIDVIDQSHETEKIFVEGIQSNER